MTDEPRPSVSPDDPRRAKTLDEASRNPDGTYNALRALSWLSEAVHPGRGFSLEEVRGIADEAAAKKRAEKLQKTEK